MMGKIVKQTLADQVYLALRRDIIEGNVKCGAKLTIKAMEERFGVSSSPIREAMNRLYKDGLLEYCTNRGAKVIEITKKDIIEIYDFCLELDCIAIKFALRNCSYEEIAQELHETILLQEETIDIEDSSLFKKASDDFHIVFYNHADNSRLLNTAERIRGQFSILTSMYHNIKEARYEVLKGHKEIYEAISNRDYEGATRAMSKHLHGSREFVLDNAIKLGLQIRPG